MRGTPVVYHPENHTRYQSTHSMPIQCKPILFRRPDTIELRHHPIWRDHRLTVGLRNSQNAGRLLKNPHTLATGMPLSKHSSAVHATLRYGVVDLIHYYLQPCLCSTYSNPLIMLIWLDRCNDFVLHPPGHYRVRALSPSVYNSWYLFNQIYLPSA